MVDIRQRETKGEISSKYSISALLSQAIDFLYNNVLLKEFKSYLEYVAQLELFEKKQINAEIDAFLRAFEEYEKKPTHFRLFLENLSRLAIEESSFTSGLLDVKPLSFKEILLKAKEQTDKKIKLDKKPQEAVIFAGICELAERLDSKAEFAGTKHKLLTEYYKTLKASRKASLRGNIPEALFHLSNALKLKKSLN